MKEELIRPDKGQTAIPIRLVNKDGFEAFAKGLSGPQRAALAGQKFTGAGYQVGIVPDGEGWFAVGGVKNPASLSSWCLAKLAGELPAGTYRLADGEPGPALHGWQTAQYAFTRPIEPGARKSCACTRELSRSRPMWTSISWRLPRRA